MLFVGCWWQIPIGSQSPFSPASLSVATDQLDELWSPVLCCNPLEPVCLQPPPLHTQTDQQTHQLSSQVKNNTCFFPMSSVYKDDMGLEENTT